MRNLWRFALFASFSAVAGCDRVVKVETFPKLATIEQDGSVGCSRPGYCYGMRYDGKFGLGYGPFCPGSQAAVVKHIPARRTYESGTVQDYTIDTTVLVKGECQ